MSGGDRLTAGPAATHAAGCGPRPDVRDYLMNRFYIAGVNEKSSEIAVGVAVSGPHEAYGTLAGERAARPCPSRRSTPR